MCQKIKLLLYLSLFSTGITTAMGQISGTINTYTKVTAVDYLCNFITVTSPTGFAAGDKVLLIQMQGAIITQTNTVNFGDISSIGDAGNYEFAIIDHFAGNDVYFSRTLLRTYTPSGSVQMISVPQYAAVSVDGELSAKAWDGNTGGVLVFESSDVVTLNANINVSEQGFRGGDKSTTGGACGSSGNGFYTYSYPDVNGGQKGEGIALYVVGKESGRAKQANGGGGGNSHNTGGGGGGNYGGGGRGGDKKTTGCGIAQSPFGYGALGLGTTFYNSTQNKIFMGGGGGGGQQNNGLSFDAGNGGGIIIIQASSLSTNGHLIQSNGGSVASFYSASSPASADNGDGNSGGGAGGTVLLDITNYTGTTLVEVKGGKGGDTGYLNFDYGPGGGGGGGVVWSSSVPTSSLITMNASGGLSGISGAGTVSGTPYGSGTAFGAVNGSIGAALNALSIPQSTSTSSCALPVELLSFKATAQGKYKVQVNWSTATELNNHFFTLERSTDGIHFLPVAKLYGQESSQQLTSYTYNDEVHAYSILYYKLSQTDINGHTENLGIRKVYPSSDQLVFAAYPNPFKDELYLTLDQQSKEAIKNLALINVYGESIPVTWEESENALHLSTVSVPSGLYSLILCSASHQQVIKVIKE